MNRTILLMIGLFNAATVGCAQPQLNPLAAHLRLPSSADVGVVWVGHRTTHALFIENVSGIAIDAIVAVEGDRLKGEAFAVAIGAGSRQVVDVPFEAVTMGPLIVDAFVVTFEGTSARIPVNGEAQTPPDCSPPDPCISTAFDPGSGTCTATSVADGTPCEGVCVVGHCTAGTCFGQQRECPDDLGDACTLPACDPARGCALIPATCRASSTCTTAACNPQTGCEETPVADGTSCGEPNCDQDHVCIEGRCEARPPPDERAVVRCLHAARVFVPWNEGIACAEPPDAGSVCWGSVSSAFAGVDPYILDEQKSPPWFARFEPALRFVGAGAPLCGLLASQEELVCKSRGFNPAWTDGLGVGGGILARVQQLEPARDVMRLDDRLCSLAADGIIKCLSAPGGQWTIEALSGPGIVAQLHGNAYAQWPCVVLTDGTLACRGVEDTHRQPRCFEPASTERFAPLAGWPKLRQFSAEHTFACGVAIGGDVYCAGSNGYGELGRTPLGVDCYEVRAVPGVKGAVKVQVARGGACALLDDGRVACWGVNQLAPTFDGGPAVRFIDLPDRIVDIGMAIASGWSSKAVICVLTSMGRVKCAGGNRHGEAGHFTATDGGVRPHVVKEFRAVEAPLSWISVPTPQ